MALTAFQRHICRLIAENRKASGESYVAGGAALNELLRGSRVSKDVDLFHDTSEALEASWKADSALLRAEALDVTVVRERPFFVEAQVRSDTETVLLQWAQDSAYRFFPLVEHDELGLVLHPFDLATNKVLALVGRLEVRDWIDVITCHDRLQPLGYLAWAACGKDPGFSPTSILQHARRSSRYSADEVNSLSFAGGAPDAAALGQQWHRLLSEGEDIVHTLPAAEVGKCVLNSDGSLFRGSTLELEGALAASRLRFHPGAIQGALPRLIEDG